MCIFIFLLLVSSVRFSGAQPEMDWMPSEVFRQANYDIGEASLWTNVHTTNISAASEWLVLPAAVDSASYGLSANDRIHLASDDGSGNTIFVEYELVGSGAGAYWRKTDGDGSSSSSSSAAVLGSGGAGDILYAAGIIDAASNLFTYSIGNGKRIDFDFPAFGLKFNGLGAKPGILPGGSPGAHGGIFVVLTSGTFLPGTVWELIYKYETVAIVQTTQNQGLRLPVHYSPVQTMPGFYNQVFQKRF